MKNAVLIDFKCVRIRVEGYENIQPEVSCAFEVDVSRWESENDVREVNR